MAKRTVFYVDQQGQAQQAIVDFQWFAGFAKRQLLKSIQSLHAAFLGQQPTAKILEISSASPEKLGVAASAFNLRVMTSHGEYTVEQLFQAGKVFKKHGDQSAVLKLPSKQAKKQIKLLHQTDELVGFEQFGYQFPLTPQTFFYNWIYLKALQQNKEIGQALLEYDAFTDIYFNSQKSLNCQADACSIYVSLAKRGLLKQALVDADSFLKVVYHDKSTPSKRQVDHDSKQLSLW